MLLSGIHSNVTFTVGMEKLIEDSDLVPEANAQVRVCCTVKCTFVHHVLVCLMCGHFANRWHHKALVAHVQQQCSLGRERAAEWLGLLYETPQGEGVQGM